jgi:hypothetical protein
MHGLHPLISAMMQKLNNNNNNNNNNNGGDNNDNNNDSRDTSVGALTSYGMEGPGFESQQQQNSCLSQIIQTGSENHLD